MLSFGFTLLALVAGAFLGNWFKTIQLRLDRELSRLDDMVREITLLQGLTKDYWVVDRFSHQKTEMFDQLEAEILGRFQLLNTIFVHVGSRLEQEWRIVLQKSLTIFWENATGGDFGDNERKKDLARVQRVYRTGGDLIEAVRENANRKLIAFPERFIFWAGTRWSDFNYWFSQRD